MARTARTKSESGVYHIVVRGIGKQILFEDDGDRLRFLKAMQQYRTELAVSLYAYCLMENHVHLLIRDRKNNLDLFMKKLEGSYAYYFNTRYERTGTLFQGRFNSEPVETDVYFLTVLRYIIRNPEKAGICRHSEYPWSSYGELTGKRNWTDTAFVRDLFDAVEDLRAFLAMETEDCCLDVPAGVIRDSEAQMIIRKILCADSGTVLQSYGRNERDAAIRQLKAAGLSVRQIERLTGINRGVILKA